MKAAGCPRSRDMTLSLREKASREKASALLAAYGRRIGVPDLAMPGTDCCQVIYDGDIIINVDYLEDSERLMLSIPIIEIPPENRSAAYADLMALNLFREELGGGCLALLKDANLAVLTLQLPLDDTLEVDGDLAETVENLAEAAQVWRSALTGEFANEDMLSPDQVEAGSVRV